MTSYYYSKQGFDLVKVLISFLAMGAFDDAEGTVKARQHQRVHFIVPNSLWNERNALRLLSFFWS
jgi:hypothetical protein